MGQVLAFPDRRQQNAELTKTELARLWRCSRRTIERYSDPAYTKPRGIDPLPHFHTPMGEARFLLGEVSEWRSRWAKRRAS